MPLSERTIPSVDDRARALLDDGLDTLMGRVDGFTLRAWALLQAPDLEPALRERLEATLGALLACKSLLWSTIEWPPTIESADGPST
jgi:hypothetical protein